mgnify:CR=1 FL=1
MEERLKKLEERVAELEKNSHPERAIVTPADFMKLKDELTNLMLSLSNQGNKPVKKPG